MNIEKTIEIEQTSNSREKLMNLEKEGKFVFHGSPNLLDELEPRQAKGYNEETGQYENDGKPAIFATSFADAAIFSALIEKDPNFENEISIDNKKQLNFLADKTLIERAKNKTAYVYVLKKEDFFDFRGLDCKSEKKEAPLEVVKVTFKDLPKNIKIVN